MKQTSTKPLCHLEATFLKSRAWNYQHQALANRVRSQITVKNKKQHRKKRFKEKKEKHRSEKKNKPTRSSKNRWNIKKEKDYKRKGKKTKINQEQFESKQINKILGRHGKGCKMREAGTFLCVAEKTESARILFICFDSHCSWFILVFLPLRL